jgi:hypothetical protein
MASPYGRPWERRKAAILAPGVICWICGEPLRWAAEGTLDHVIPVADGGGRGPVRPAHRRCNLKRSAERTNAIRRQKGPAAPTRRRVWPGALDPSRDADATDRLGL